MSGEHLPEPWLRGPLADEDPLLMPTLHALQQAHEDLRLNARGLSDAQAWARPHGLTSLGFHLRHIAGSLDRLTTYLRGRALNEEQLAFLQAESQPGASLRDMLDDVDRAIERTSRVLRSLDLTTLRDKRGVGRRELPTTVIGLTVHIAEHTQRHVGQAITTCLLLKAMPTGRAGK
jgi:uncharacterized damage-inducible protein DinB